MSKAGGLGRLRGGSSGQAARTPFVLLVVALLAGGLISLLLLNSALNQGSFQLSRLKKETTAITDEEQALQRDVDGYSAPDALQRRALELGLVPGGSPVFIGPDGKVTGTAAVAEALPPPPGVTPSPAGPPAAVPPGSAPVGTPGSAPAGGAPVGTPAGTPGSAPAGTPAGAPQTGQPVQGGAPQPTPTPGR
ncbi:hypothetical protein AB0I68_01480 [Streptomyces sp. NPDC050448]|uniref:hypothetical protein n=1 Tax=Streptomyces sp. NPDC050448 TaxID=3155404 RepID=UPI003413BAC4